MGDYPWNTASSYKPSWDRMNSLFRRVVSEIRKIDSRHIIFLEGDNYGKQFFGFDKPSGDNIAYSSHNYTPSGFGPGKYPGTYPSGVGAAGGSELWDLAKQERFFLEAEGTRFTGTQRLRHLRAESVFCAGVAVDEVFHVHPSARTGTPEANSIPLGIDDVAAADAKELHLAFALKGVHR
jgi:hypothetical protein